MLRVTKGTASGFSEDHLLKCLTLFFVEGIQSWVSKEKDQEKGHPVLLQSSCQVPGNQRGVHSNQPAHFLGSRARTSDLKQRVTSCFVSEPIMEQDIHSDGFNQMECMLLFAFLEESSGCEFREQLPSLQSQGIVYPLKDILYCDGDGELQTDGNRSGHFQNGELVFDPAVNEEIVRTIAAQLAEIGDQLDKEIKAKVVNDLVQHFLNENLSREEITRCLSQAVEVLARAIPSDLEREKAMLVLAMVLTKKVANKVPFLLQRVFSTTVNYISQHFHGYVVRMLRE